MKELLTCSITIGALLLTGFVIFWLGFTQGWFEEAVEVMNEGRSESAQSDSLLEKEMAVGPSTIEAIQSHAGVIEATMYSATGEGVAIAFLQLTVESVISEKEAKRLGEAYVGYHDYYTKQWERDRDAPTVATQYVVEISYPEGEGVVFRSAQSQPHQILWDSAGIQTAPQVAPEDVRGDIQGEPQSSPQDAPLKGPPDQSHVTLTPTNTPRPTLIPDSPAAFAEAATLRAARATTESEPGPPLDAQVTEYTREYKDRRYEAIVRAVVDSHRVVEPNLEIDWPDEPYNPPYMEWNEGEYLPWLRTKLDIKKTYYGNLPQGYELLAPEFAVNQALEVDKEYIIYIGRLHVSDTEFPDRTDVRHYNEEQLNALGGPGGHALMGRTWIIEGGTAWRITRDYVLSDDARTGLVAAKDNGESLSVAALEAAINAGLGN